ncbi:hypothetical protein PSZ24_23225, partial [Shigella flexneri]|nr:hypothetical protein [Shigella flexneri]
LLVLFLFLVEMLPIFLPLKMMLAVGLPQMDFIILRWFTSLPTFWRILSTIGVEFFQKLFLYLLR